jgi:tRNA-splicing ligase RtcB
MRVPGIMYINPFLREMVLDELQAAVNRGEQGGFLPAVKQLANVATLPGIVKASKLDCLPMF